MTTGVPFVKMPILNRLLAAIPPSEYARLRTRMDEVEMPFGTTIYNAGDAIRYVYFPNSGVVSLLTVVDRASTVDIGMTGREGMVGISALMGVMVSAGRAIVSVKGTAIKLAVADLENALGERGVFQSVVLRFMRSMFVQVSRSAGCFSFHGVESRLARSLLMITDRTGSDKLRITQEFIANMLGVRREAVNRAIASLRASELISHNRNIVRILNRAGLEAAACECYQMICDEESSFAFSV